MALLSIPDRWKRVQNLVGATTDGTPGAQTLACLEVALGIEKATEVRIIRSKAVPWEVEVHGDDLVVKGIKCTWFGGDSDPMDNGLTASGVKTKGHPELIGCSLPMEIGAQFKATHGSPIPKLPWKTLVEVSYNRRSVRAPLIDLGPDISRYPSHALDLTIAAFKTLGGTVKGGTLEGVSFRVVGGAKFLPV